MSQADNNAEKTSLDTAVTYADVVRYTTALLAYDKQARHAQAAAMAAAHAMGLDPEETKELVEQMLEESNLEPIASHMAAAAASAGGKSKKGEKGSRVKKEKAAGSRTGKMSAWNLFATKVMHHIKGEHPDAKVGADTYTHVHP